MENSNIIVMFIVPLLLGISIGMAIYKNIQTKSENKNISMIENLIFSIKNMRIDNLENNNFNNTKIDNKINQLTNLIKQKISHDKEALSIIISNLQNMKNGKEDEFKELEEINYNNKINQEISKLNDKFKTLKQTLKQMSINGVVSKSYDENIEDTKVLYNIKNSFLKLITKNQELELNQKLLIEKEENNREKLDILIHFIDNNEIDILDLIKTKEEKKSLELKMNNKIKEILRVNSENKRIKKEVNKELESIKNNNSQLEQFNEIIDELSFQINILSLNAAIEASTVKNEAFALIAEEIRKMSDRSSDYSNKIKIETLELKEKTKKLEKESKRIDNNNEFSYEVINDFDLLNKESLNIMKEREKKLKKIEKEIKEVKKNL